MIVISTFKQIMPHISHILNLIFHVYIKFCVFYYCSCLDNLQQAPRLLSLDKSARCGTIGYGYAAVKFTSLTRRQFISNITTITNALQFSWNVASLAITLLHRYLLVATPDDTTDMTSLLSALVISALKVSSIAIAEDTN